MKVLFIIVISFLALFAGESLRVQFNRKPQFKFAGFYMAKELGLYEKAGIDVTFLHLDPEKNVDIKKTLQEEDADIGVHYASIIPYAAQTKRFRIISYLFQTSPLVVVAKKNVRLLRKKGCLYIDRNEYGATSDLVAKKMGITCKKPYDVERFIADPNGLISTYLPQITPLQGTVVKPIDYGYDFYDDIVFTTERFYQRHKSTVRRFMLATLQGWRYALKHPEEAARVVQRYDQNIVTLSTLTQEAHRYLEHAIFSVRRVGIFNREKLQRMLQVYKESGVLSSDPPPLDRFVDPLFLDWIDLSDAQRALIATTRIRYSETNWPPFSIVEGENVVGIMRDFIDIVAKRSGLDMHYVPKAKWSDVLLGIRNATIDMAMGTGKTDSRSRYAVFADPYGEYSFGIATKRNNIVSSIEELNGKTVAVGENYTAHEILKKYKHIRVRTYKDTKEALEALNDGKVDAVVDIFPTLSYYIAIALYKDVVIATTMREKFALRAMFRKDLAAVRDIFNKALATVSEEEKKRIAQKYSSRTVYIVNEQKERYFLGFIFVLLVVIASFIVLALRLHKELKRRIAVEEKLQKLVNKDPLTNIYNRRFFNTFMESELAFVKRNGGMILFAIFDIDNFKRYNDTYGHLKGDAVLQKVASKVKSMCKRKSDYVFRLGGEEFGIYARVDNPEHVETYVASFVQAVSDLKIEHTGNPNVQVVTISLGALLATIEKGADVSLERIYKTADDLMYEAKKNGKNRYVMRHERFSNRS